MAPAAVLALGFLFGPGAPSSRAQGALDAAGTAGARVVPWSYRPASPAYYRRYRVYDARTGRYVGRYVPVRRTAVYDPSTGQYLAAEVPVRGVPTPRYSPTSNVTVSRPLGVINPRRRAAGIGAEGTGGRTHPREWIGP
jgi:hypothetical protein